MKGSLMYRKEDFVKAVDYIAQGKCTIDPLITHHFAFDDYMKAHDLINAKREPYVAEGHD